MVAVFWDKFLYPIIANLKHESHNLSLRQWVRNFNFGLVFKNELEQRWIFPRYVG